MARILITGSTDGLGKLAAKKLIHEGHQVVLHARNLERAKEVIDQVKGAESVLTADLAQLEEDKNLALEANKLGKFDSIIHNAGVLNSDPETIFNVNVLAPYVLSALINKPKRIVYLSSSMHFGGKPISKLEDIGKITYSDSKLLVTTMMKAIARLFPETYSNAVDPGWVPTKMGGKNAPDDLQKGIETQVWLATSEEKSAKVSGLYFRHQKALSPHPAVLDEDFQNHLIQLCEEVSGVNLLP